MEISTEKRIADATAKEIAELEALKECGYIVVPYHEFVRMTKDAHDFRLILSSYQIGYSAAEILALITVMAKMQNDKTLMAINKELEQLMKARQEKKSHEPPFGVKVTLKPDDKAGDPK